ncbi:hypothetical protein [Streptomyces flaveolus]|uniref:hypothetical protein n=1 Tax=Streptomyces flaveolus TaxID=67297 RepID=UPI0036F9334F
MTSVRMLTAAATAAAAFATLPSTVHAAPLTSADECASAQASADKAQQDYDAAKKDYEALIAAGGTPGIAERQELADADVRRSALAAEAERICDTS